MSKGLPGMTKAKGSAILLSVIMIKSALIWYIIAFLDYSRFGIFQKSREFIQKHSHNLSEKSNKLRKIWDAFNNHQAFNFE